MHDDNVDSAVPPEGDIDEAQLFETLCELEPEAQAQRLRALDPTHPALAARLRRLLAIDEAYGTHTARSVVTPDMSDPVGDISDIGAFRLVRQIGRGGMGVVYLAERRSDFAQQVAIKIMPRFAIDDMSRERFAQERRILAQLRHPNICSILDGGELAEGTPWLAMEYVPGESLCAWCERTGSGLRERIGLFLQLCDAVQYAHRNLVIHRDLKDSNVLVCEHGDARGTVKLLDFGIAKSLVETADGGQTALQDRFFSPMTAAPEQLRGERATVAVDVYALGVLLHQLLCGALPFARPHRDPIELQRAILDTVPPRMSEALARERESPAAAADAGASPIAARELQGELDAIVAHCLRKDASERYVEVGDLARDLRAWLSGHPISISGHHRLYRLRKFVRRNRVGVAFAALTACSVLIALAVTLWQAAALRTERDAAQAARARSDIDRDRARTVAGFMRSAFEEADPGKASEGGLLARELIERGKRRLDRLDDQPDVQAELALLLAESNAGMGLVQESDALFRKHAETIETLSATDPKVRWRAGLLQLSNQIVLANDGPPLDAALSALQRIADTPEAHVQVARQQERLQVRRSEFGLAARTLEGAGEGQEDQRVFEALGLVDGDHLDEVGVAFKAHLAGLAELPPDLAGHLHRRLRAAQRRPQYRCAADLREHRSRRAARSRSRPADPRTATARARARCARQRPRCVDPDHRRLEAYGRAALRQRFAGGGQSVRLVGRRDHRPAGTGRADAQGLCHPDREAAAGVHRPRLRRIQHGGLLSGISPPCGTGGTASGASGADRAQGVFARACRRTQVRADLGGNTQQTGAPSRMHRSAVGASGRA